MTYSGTEVFEELKNRIKRGCRVVLWDCSDDGLNNFTHNRVLEKNISAIEIWHCGEGIGESEILHHISEEKMRVVLDTYRTYDFSDKIKVVSETTQYGSLINYVKTGILTKEEAVEALLYNI